MSRARQPQWVADAENWPTPDDCRRMTQSEAESEIRSHVDQAIQAQLVADFHAARVARFTDIAKRISAAHPAATAAVTRQAKDHR